MAGKMSSFVSSPLAPSRVLTVTNPASLPCQSQSFSAGSAGWSRGGRGARCSVYTRTNFHIVSCLLPVWNKSPSQMSGDGRRSVVMFPMVLVDCQRRNGSEPLTSPSISSPESLFWMVFLSSSSAVKFEDLKYRRHEILDHLSAFSWWFLSEGFDTCISCG
jgi:hypothetical protein